ncbi:kicstor complex protein c12orf66 [Anaeramoeba flamelloides]|uniref:Kicstor complex protein c12orf66 n=1 Tax=Anaeramoeba flamelloides TaxID=1746091 RepID=A0ABQ8Z3L3_9EUKA|nr:kicstor complex protein c12orf66 [Anaeramoeba flamelloides]
MMKAEKNQQVPQRSKFLKNNLLGEVFEVCVLRTKILKIYSRINLFFCSNNNQLQQNKKNEIKKICKDICKIQRKFLETNTNPFTKTFCQIIDTELTILENLLSVYESIKNLQFLPNLFKMFKIKKNICDFQKRFTGIIICNLKLEKKSQEKNKGKEKGKENEKDKGNAKVKSWEGNSNSKKKTKNHSISRNNKLKLQHLHLQKTYEIESKIEDYFPLIKFFNEFFENCYNKIVIYFSTNLKNNHFRSDLNKFSFIEKQMKNIDIILLIKKFLTKNKAHCVCLIGNKKSSIQYDCKRRFFQSQNKRSKIKINLPIYEKQNGKENNKNYLKPQNKFLMTDSNLLNEETNSPNFHTDNLKKSFNIYQNKNKYKYQEDNGNDNVGVNDNNNDNDSDNNNDNDDKNDLGNDIGNENGNISNNQNNDKDNISNNQMDNEDPNIKNKSKCMEKSFSLDQKISQTTQFISVKNIKRSYSENLEDNKIEIIWEKNKIPNNCNEEDQEEKDNSIYQSGLKQYPVIFSYPSSSQPTGGEYPTLISLILDSKPKVLSLGKIFTFYDKKLNRTYFLKQVEKNITLAVIFKKKKKNKDTRTLNFIHQFISKLTLNDLWKRFI